MLDGEAWGEGGAEAELEGVAVGGHGGDDAGGVVEEVPGDFFVEAEGDAGAFPGLEAEGEAEAGAADLDVAVGVVDIGAEGEGAAGAELDGDAAAFLGAGVACGLLNGAADGAVVVYLRPSSSGREQEHARGEEERAGGRGHAVVLASSGDRARDSLVTASVHARAAFVGERENVIQVGGNAPPPATGDRGLRPGEACQSQCG